MIETKGKTIDGIVLEMMKVPLDKSMLLDFLIGHRPRQGRKVTLTDDQAELYRLQMFLNSRYRGRRFDWFGDNPISQMVRKSISEESWKPKLQSQS